MLQLLILECIGTLKMRKLKRNQWFLVHAWIQLQERLSRLTILPVVVCIYCTSCILVGIKDISLQYFWQWWGHCGVQLSMLSALSSNSSLSHSPRKWNNCLTQIVQNPLVPNSTDQDLSLIPTACHIKVYFDVHEILSIYHITPCRTPFNFFHSNEYPWIFV